MTTDANPANPAGLAIWNLGFRPFFLGAGLFAAVGMALWLVVYGIGVPLYPPGVALTQWHAHEMLFGYTLAVIAGFLLTAVKNWTGLQTPHRAPLAGLFVLWLVARVANHSGAAMLAIGTAADLLFNGLLIVAITLPVARSGQWKQMAVVGKLILLALLNVLFYLDAWDQFDRGAFFAVYGAFYTVLALILMMMRRLIPFFVERGVDVKLKNSKFLDLASLVLFVELMISELFGIWVGPTLWVAAALFVIHLVRLVMWYTPRIWRRPLLWSLYLAYAMIVAGFALFALTPWLGVPKLLALHAFAVGGMGIVTLGMMSRVSLGHTGRDLHEPPLLVAIGCVLVAGAALVRVIGPLVDAAHYTVWVDVSGGLWILGFAGFAAAYAPILLRPRVDGRYG
ncbi:MAG: NnrS family protein [Gammaproteobacteria bacterium]|nr:NnrS family protein [Gammaproteobacteria bacterium]NNF62408.1 NnrS family protein [Gammaproteobacteria bacterium]NNM21203.1 NnrS family protein [Gammaproteobacteria bacterium]